MMVYGLLTAVIFVLFWLTTAVLDSAPRLIIDRETRLPSGWHAVADTQHTMTLNLPPRWQQVSLTDSPWADPTLQHTFAIFSEADANLSVQLLAVDKLPAASEMPTAFVAAVSSQRLHSITPQQLVDFVTNNVPNASRAEVQTRLALPTQAQFRYSFNEPATPYECLLRFTPYPSQGQIAAACATGSSYSLMASDFETILNTFQRLQSD